MDLPGAVRFALRLLSTAAEFDSATGGVDVAAGQFATIRLLSPSGVASVGDADQAAFMGMGQAGQTHTP